VLHTLGAPRLGDPGLNTPGLIAFTATLAGPGVTPASSSVLLAGRADLSVPRVVLRTGDAFATPAGVKTIRQISFDHDRAGRAQLSGNALAAHLLFTDGAQAIVALTVGCTTDIDGDGDEGTDSDIEAFFAALAGDPCPACSTDIDADGDEGTDADVETLFRLIAGGTC
jgi:hypothetical protein